MQRTVYIDIAKCIAIWLVLWGHAITELMPHDLSQNRVYVMIYSFHMPLFMLMSGLFAKKAMALGFLVLFKKKFMQLIVPSLTFGIVWYLIEHIAYGGWSVLSFIKHESTCYWFLKSLFLCFVVTRICYALGRWRNVAMAVVLLIFLYIQKWDITCFKLGNMLPFFWGGMWMKDKLGWLEIRWKTLAAISLLCFAVAFSWYRLDYSFATYFFHSMDMNAFFGYGFYLLTATLGCVAVIALCMGLPSIEILSKVGMQTLGIYLWQKILLEELLPLFVKVEMPMGIYNYLFTTVVACIMMWVCYVATRLRISDFLLKY